MSVSTRGTKTEISAKTQADVLTDNSVLVAKIRVKFKKILKTNRKRANMIETS